MTLFCCFLTIAAAIYVAGEFLLLDMGMFSSASRQQQFISSTVMILLTISLLPLALRLFKFKHIQADLQKRQALALLRWGGLRMTVIGLLLVVNTLLYYAFEYESTYGYLAVVVLLCMPFIIPTMGRCMAEVSHEPVHPESDEEERTDNEETDSSHS